ncbi:MAG: PfkB family carbohydrate kinase [Spirochaetia bacterium]|nr:PfkB family carbohydrate kinase [Spirochaetia bacterium]
MNTTLLGIGNPIFDMYSSIDNRQLSCIRHYVDSAAWGQTFHVEDSVFEQLLTCVKPKLVIPGGGAFNTIRILTQLGHSAGFIGALGGRETPILHTPPLTAEFFYQEMKNHGIIDYTHTYNDQPCGRSLYLYQSAQRLLIVNPAAAVKLQDPEEGLLKKLDPHLIYVEGFLLPRHRLLQEVCDWQRYSGATIAVDLGAPPLVRHNRDFIVSTVLPHTTYLFGTEEEIGSLEIGYEEIRSKLANGTLVVKKGAAGSSIYHRTGFLEIPPHKTEVLDSTGAGDAYAAFYLSGILHGTTDRTAAEAAAYGSSLVLSNLGGSIDTSAVTSVAKIFS